MKQTDEVGIGDLEQSPSEESSGEAISEVNSSASTPKPPGSQTDPCQQLQLRSSKRRSRGPRTPQGKATTRVNALKHGIFSEVLLLEFEPKDEFRALLWGLRRSFEPQGTFEEVLVEKLATILWRHRRLLQAESAELKTNIERAELDKAERLNRLFDIREL